MNHCLRTIGGAFLTGALMGGPVGAGAATTLTFETLSAEGDAIPGGYAGFDWSGAGFGTVGTVMGCLGPLAIGYCLGDSSNTLNTVAYDFAETSQLPSVIAWVGASAPYFELLGADFGTAAGTQNLTVRGYRGPGPALFTDTFSVAASGVVSRTFNGWIGLSRIEIEGVITGPSAGKTPWVLDNFSFQASSIPEPSAWTLLAAGLGLVALARRPRG
jgi:hypothetical protein